MSLNLGGLHEKHAVATWNLGTVSAFAQRQRKTKKTCVEMAGLKNSVRTSKRTPHFTITETNWLIAFKEIIAVYSDDNTEPINTKYRATDF
jgi:hypothetical protein